MTLTTLMKTDHIQAVEGSHVFKTSTRKVRKKISALGVLAFISCKVSQSKFFLSSFESQDLNSKRVLLLLLTLAKAGPQLGQTAWCLCSWEHHSIKILDEC